MRAEVLLRIVRERVLFGPGHLRLEDYFERCEALWEGVVVDLLPFYAGCYGREAGGTS